MAMPVQRSDEFVAAGARAAWMSLRSRQVEQIS
jgi:hypothetical protein